MNFCVINLSTSDCRVACALDRITAQTPWVRPQPRDRLFCIIFAVFLVDQGVSEGPVFKIFSSIGLDPTEWQTIF